MASNKLEQAAILARKLLTTKNDFRDDDINNHYSATHTKAVSDQTTPVHGKGTGVGFNVTTGEFDTTNGGGEYDIHGNINHAGSGRIKNTVINTYNDTKRYTTPDTSGNVGQVTIE